MQGDIAPPRPPKRHRPAPTPKIVHRPSPPPQPDISIDEAELDDMPKKERRLLIAPHKHFKRFWKWWLGLNRNERFAIIAVALLVFGAGALGWFTLVQPDSNPSLTVVHHPKKPKPPTTVASPLTGAQIDPALATRPVTGIMIENSDDARP